MSQNPDDRKCRPRRTGRAPPRAQGARRPSAPGGSAGRARGRCLGLRGLKLPKGASRVRDAAGPQRPASWALRKGNVPFGIGQKTARVSGRKPGSRQPGRAGPGGNAATDAGCAGKRRASRGLRSRRGPPLQRAPCCQRARARAAPRASGGPTTDPAPDSGQGRPAAGRGMDAVGGVGTASAWPRSASHLRPGSESHGC